MAELIKTITDTGVFEKIFYKFFLNSSVFLKTKSGDLKIQFFGYTEGQVALRIPFVKNMFENCLIFTRSENVTIYSHLRLVEKQADESYIFVPVKFQVISAARREDRKVVELGGEGKSILYVTNIISDFIIQNSLAMENKKVDHVKETVRFDLEKQFKMVRIYFCNEGLSDPRMKYFLEKRTPIFIPNIDKKEAGRDESLFNLYHNEIYHKDHHLVNRKQLISEVSVPVLYRGKIPYGYIQGNAEAVLTEPAMAAVKRMAVLVEELFAKYRIFPASEDRLLVSDVSRNGIGIVFKERRFIRFFKENSLVYFDIMLPDNKKSSCLAVVRHIDILESKIIKIGCEIREFDSLGEVNYEEYLRSIGLS